MPWSCACLYTFSHKTSRSAININALHRLGHRGEAALEIRDQVVNIFEPDVEPHCRATRRPAGGGAQVRAVERDDEALVAAPGCADAEQRERVDERECGGLRHRPK